MLKAKVIVKGNCIICGKPIDDNVFFCKVCERGNYMSELDNPISEKKMQIVINNYFKGECDVNTSIREAFAKGFRIGVQKGQCIKHAPSAQPEITDEQAIEHLQSTGWMQNHDRILTQSTWDIIRCKDCKYGDTFHEFDEPDMPMKCLGQHYGGTYPDDFCSYAERRTE